MDNIDNHLDSLKINESELFMKYKPSYKSAFLDFSVYTFLMYSLFYTIWCFRNSWLSIFTTPLLGFMLNRTFIIFHDCCHNSYTPNKELNYIISHITGALVATSPNWILDHHTHHKTNGNIENDEHYFFNETIILTKKQFLTNNDKLQLFYRIYKNPLVFFTIVPIIYFGIVQRFIYIIKKYRHPDAFEQSLFMITRDHLINNVLCYLYLYAIFNFGIMSHYICGVILAASISFMTFHNQHSYNPSYVVENNKWTQRDSGLVGSSFIQIPSLLKYFYMGIEYHHIHHINAKIPGYNLQKYHEEVITKSDMFENIVTLNMYDCYNNLWLVLYDEDKKKYITFKELESNKNL
jgi:omega-6 fatty acid desaturase (delta-12 desaturase)